MSNENLQQATAASRDICPRNPSVQQDCSDVIHISIFFDGTGNNKDVDEDSKKWSNPARIWRSADLWAVPDSSCYPIYISGVGTPFNGNSFGLIDDARIKIEDSTLLGQGSGYGGTRRIDYGQQQINDALRSALLAQAQKLGGQVKRYAESAKKESFSDVHHALRQHRLIKQINVSIFGFSRGAALARAFSNQWIWQCKEDHGQLFYEGYPIQFVFLGLFDTVASFGLPSANLNNTLQFCGFEGRDLVVDDRIERCVHYVAAHELRFSFPVDLVRKNGNLPSRWLEKAYPGVHTDVGGGYDPKAQDITNNYARIPMRDMMNEALLKGVRLLSYKILEKKPEYKTIFQERFECKPETESAYQAYTVTCNPKGSVEHCMREHMTQLYSAYGTLKRQGGVNLTARQHQQGKSWIGGPKDMGTEIETYERLRSEYKNSLRADTNVDYQIIKGIHAMWIQPQEWQKNAWYAPAPEGVVTFINSYIHDSKVGFLKNIEPFSYFSQRGVSESNRSIYGWLEYNVNRPINHVLESTTDYVTEKAQQAQKIATQTAQKAQQAGAQAVEKVQSTASQAWESVTDAAQRTKDMASEAAVQAQQAASSVASNVADTAAQAGQALSEATQSTLNRIGQAWEELAH